MMRPCARFILLIALTSLLAACGGPGPAEKPPYAGIKLGKPYYTAGRWYKPHYDEHYDEIGMASWYGPGFHGGRTASGERYDQEELTAAHRTLPLPSIVRVTNLDNGRSAIIRINDRGPFARDRILDLSHASAVKLGIIRTGSARVRVQFLPEETYAYVNNLGMGRQYAMMTQQPQQPPPLASLPPEQAQELADRTAQTAPLPPPVTVITAEPVTAPHQAQSQEDIFAAADTQDSAQDSAQDDDTPARLPKPTLIPASVTYTSHAVIPAQGSGSYFVQAGTFGIKENAQKLIARLEDSGEVQLREIAAGSRKLYRVTLGPYDAQADARNMLSKLAAIGIPDARIIRD